MKKVVSAFQLNTILLGVLLLNLWDLYLFISQFLFVYSDSDQTILWQAAIDMAANQFYEPAFYGQAYNSMAESLLAVPLIKLGLFTPFAVSLTSIFLSYSVIWLFAFYYFRRGNFLITILILALPIIMPTEFQVMIGIPRGFIPGIAATLLGIYFFISKMGKWTYLLSGFLIALGFVLNPNMAVIMSVFAIWYLLKPNSNKKKEVFFLLLGSIPALLFKLYIRWFYTVNSNYNIHDFPNPFQYSISNWLKVASEVFYVFKGLFPVVNNLGCLSLILLLILTFLIVKRSNLRHEKLAILCGLLFILFSFGINKVGDGTGSPFFAYARMYLGIPVIYIFCIRILQPYSSAMTDFLLLFLAISGVFIYKTYALPDRINYLVKHNTGVVKVFKIKDLCRTCDSIQNYMKQTGSEIMVFANKKDEANYGCSALYDINTIHPSYERRTWVYAREMFQPRRKILIYSQRVLNDSNLIKLAPNYFALNLNGRSSIEEWAKRNQFTLRKYTTINK